MREIQFSQLIGWTFTMKGQVENIFKTIKAYYSTRSLTKLNFEFRSSQK